MVKAETHRIRSHVRVPGDRNSRRDAIGKGIGIRIPRLGSRPEECQLVFGTQVVIDLERGNSPVINAFPWVDVVGA